MAKRGMKPHQAAALKVKNGVKLTKLQKVRLSKGFSQAELAEVSGVSMRAIHSFEQRARALDRAKFNTVVDLCLALNCSFDDIIEDETMLRKLQQVK